MKSLYLISAAAAAASLAGPAGAQTYPYTYPQPAYPQQTYPYSQPYGYPQPGYGTNPVEQIINQLLGNRYSVSDRTQVSRCARAAVDQAERQYGAYGYNGYGQPYGQGYNPQYGYNNSYSRMRVTAITEVERRSNNGLRVEGLISSGLYAQPYGYPGYGNQGYGYGDPRYAQTGDLWFRCNVDYRGMVTNLRVNRNRSPYRR